MIDLDPSDKTCIYSTLLFVSEQAKRYHVTPVITFDQPLWLEALMIVRSEPQDSELKFIVLRLGGLHTEMSFLGCTAHIMNGRFGSTRSPRISACKKCCWAYAYR